MEVYDRGTYKDVRYPEWRQNGGHVKVDGGRVNNRAEYRFQKSRFVLSTMENGIIPSRKIARRRGKESAEKSRQTSPRCVHRNGRRGYNSGLRFEDGRDFQRNPWLRFAQV